MQSSLAVGGAGVNGDSGLTKTTFNWHEYIVYPSVSWVAADTGNLKTQPAPLSPACFPRRFRQINETVPCGGWNSPWYPRPRRRSG